MTPHGLSARIYTLIILAAVVTITSCIPIRRAVLLQDKAQPRSHTKFIDTTFTHALAPYRLQEGDVLFIQITRLPITDRDIATPGESAGGMGARAQHPYMMGYTINDSGDVVLPVIGEVPMAGQTIEEANRTMQAKAERHYTGAAVKLYLLNYNVTVLGEVRSPGRYSLYDRDMSLLDVLGMAGGMAEFANRQTIKVVREDGGKTTIYHVDLTDQRWLTASGLYMHPNDIIIVNPMRRKQLANPRAQWVISTLSTAAVIISVILSATR